MSVYKTSPGKKHKERFINRQQAHQNNALLDSKTNAAFSSYCMRWMVEMEKIPMLTTGGCSCHPDGCMIT